MKPSLVIEATPWQLTDERTGEIKRGISVRYVDFESPLVGRRHGFEPLKVSAPEDTSFRELPGYYDLRFRQRANKDGKVEVAITGARLVAPLVVPDVVD